mgnify:CR=1 FL=1
MALPITVEEVKSICNLKSLNNVQKDEIISFRMLLIDKRIKENTLAEYYQAVSDNTAEALIISLFKLAFSYLMYAEILEFLNTNTSGTGIIKSTGFAETRVELLSQEETDKRRNSLELKAYLAIEDYLNQEGKMTLKKLKFYSELERVDVDNIESKANVLKNQNQAKKSKMVLI